MNDEIVKLRERLVELSSNPIETRDLLDKLTEAEIEQHDSESPFYVRKEDIKQTKDYKFYSVSKTTLGYMLRYKGGYDVFVDDKITTAADAMALLMDGVPAGIPEEEKESWELAISAVEMIMRAPMFVFSHPSTTFTMATVATKFLLYLQEKGEVPTPETENPEFDKFMEQMQELLDNFAVGLEKEGREYEKRMGIDNGTDKEQSESKSKSKGKAKA